MDRVFVMAATAAPLAPARLASAAAAARSGSKAVSYTHLTLPTKA